MFFFAITFAWIEQAQCWTPVWTAEPLLLRLTDVHFCSEAAQFLAKTMQNHNSLIGAEEILGGSTTHDQSNRSLCLVWTSDGSGRAVSNLVRSFWAPGSGWVRQPKILVESGPL